MQQVILPEKIDWERISLRNYFAKQTWFINKLSFESH